MERGHRRAPGPDAGRGPPAHPPAPAPARGPGRAGGRASSGTALAGLVRSVDRRRRPARVAGRVVAPAAPRLRAPRAHLHQAGPDPLLGRGPLPRGAGGRVPAAAATRSRPSPSPWCAASSKTTWAGPSTQLFSEFERTPIAAASIAQVHAARLTTGEDVVVKVQRPDVATLVRRDLAAMSWIAPLLVGRIPVAALANPPALVELFGETIVEELDFRLEAQNMLDVARVLAETGQHAIVVPRPHPALVTRRVLVMERLDGFAWGDADAMRGAGHRHRGGPARRADRLPRRGAALRRLPRRPPRRQPLRPGRRAGGPARLRHHGPVRRAAAPGLPPPGHGGVGQRRPRPDRGAARPRGAARSTSTSTP